MAGAAARHGARMVLVSSDVVFGGSDRPYDETAPTDPVSPYGEAKVAAERAVLDTCADAVVARTSLILGDGASQHEELVRRLAAGADGALFEDERRCPVHVEDLARALVELAEGDVQGVLHVAGADGMSRHELGRLIARRDGLDPDVLRATTRAALAVPGPVDVRLDSSRAAALLSTRLRGAREFLGLDRGACRPDGPPCHRAPGAVRGGRAPRLVGWRRKSSRRTRRRRTATSSGGTTATPRSRASPASSPGCSSSPPCRGRSRALLRLLFDHDTSEQLFPFVLLALALPIAMLIKRKTRRFAQFMFVGMLVTALVVRRCRLAGALLHGRRLTRPTR